MWDLRNAGHPSSCHLIAQTLNIALPAHVQGSSCCHHIYVTAGGKGKSEPAGTPCPANSWPVSCRQSFRRGPPGCCRVTWPRRAARAPRNCDHCWWPSSSCNLRFCPQRKGSGYWGTNHRISHNTLFLMLLFSVMQLQQQRA